MITIEVKEEYDFYQLLDNCWCGAIDTLKQVAQNNKQEELMQLLEDITYDKMLTMTELNDFLWFNKDYIFEDLEIPTDEE